MAKVEYKFRWAAAFEGTHDGVVGLANAAHAECEELRWGACACQFAQRVLSEIESVSRAEIVAFDGDVLVGYLSLVGEPDEVHVGVCGSVQWHYVLPKYRGTVGVQLMLRARKILRDAGVPVLSYTKRLGPGSYQLEYRRLSHGEGRKENCQDCQQSNSIQIPRPVGCE